MLQNEAQAVADQVISFRAWVAGSGMVWVNKPTPQFDEYLAVHNGSNNTSFYGKNPALTTRELSAIANKTATRAEFTVTSDNVRQKANAPDAFEKAAIATFSKDKDTEFIAKYEGNFYRYARPLLVKERCLKMPW